jgi:cell division protein FtsI/penicillin-binding protein 2
MYFVAFVILCWLSLLLLKLTNIQWVEGEYYRQISERKKC